MARKFGNAEGQERPTAALAPPADPAQDIKLGGQAGGMLPNADLGATDVLVPVTAEVPVRLEQKIIDGRVSIVCTTLGPRDMKRLFARALRQAGDKLERSA